MAFNPLPENFRIDTPLAISKNKRTSRFNIDFEYDSATQPLIPRAPSRKPPLAHSLTLTTSKDEVPIPRTPIMQRSCSRIRRRINARVKPENSGDSDGLLDSELGSKLPRGSRHDGRYLSFPVPPIQQPHKISPQQNNQEHCENISSSNALIGEDVDSAISHYNSCAATPRRLLKQSCRPSVSGLFSEELRNWDQLPAWKLENSTIRAKTDSLGRRTLKRGNDWVASVSRTIQNIGHANSGDGNYSIPKGFRLSNSSDAQGSSSRINSRPMALLHQESMAGLNSVSLDRNGRTNNNSRSPNRIEYLLVAKTEIRRPAKLSAKHGTNVPQTESPAPKDSSTKVHPIRSLRKVTASLFTRLRGSSSFDTNSFSKSERLHEELLRLEISGPDNIDLLQRPRSRPRSRSSSHWSFGTLLRKSKSYAKMISEINMVENTMAKTQLDGVAGIINYSKNSGSSCDSPDTLPFSNEHEHPDSITSTNSAQRPSSHSRVESSVHDGKDSVTSPQAQIRATRNCGDRLGFSTHSRADPLKSIIDTVSQQKQVNFREAQTKKQSGAPKRALTCTTGGMVRTPNGNSIKSKGCPEKHVGPRKTRKSWKALNPFNNDHKTDAWILAAKQSSPTKRILTIKLETGQNPEVIAVARTRTVAPKPKYITRTANIPHLDRMAERLSKQQLADCPQITERQNVAIAEASQRQATAEDYLPYVKASSFNKCVSGQYASASSRGQRTYNDYTQPEYGGKEGHNILLQLGPPPLPHHYSRYEYQKVPQQSSMSVYPYQYSEIVPQQLLMHSYPSHYVNPVIYQSTLGMVDSHRGSGIEYDIYSSKGSVSYSQVGPSVYEYIQPPPSPLVGGDSRFSQCYHICQPSYLDYQEPGFPPSRSCRGDGHGRVGHR